MTADRDLTERIALQRYDNDSIGEIFDLLVDIYVEIYGDRQDEPIQSRARFVQQLHAHSRVPSFDLVLARTDGEPVGYAYGYVLPPQARWWEGMLTPVDPGLLAEDGRRTFALCELMVRRAWQGRGLARLLHRHLVEQRPEQRATLLVEKTNRHAQEIYARWGYRKIGDLRPSWPNAPVFDALNLPLHDQQRATSDR